MLQCLQIYDSILIQNNQTVSSVQSIEFNVYFYKVYNSAVELQHYTITRQIFCDNKNVLVLVESNQEYTYTCLISVKFVKIYREEA